MTNKNDNIVYRNQILSLLNSLEINDAWRTLNPNTRRYTWHSRGRSSRLDYFFISDHLLNNLTNYRILPGLFSDHSILIMNFDFDFYSRGRGYWKFNSNLLHDKNYVRNIKEIIKDSTNEFNTYDDKGLVWEMVKLKIRSFSVPYCIKKKKERSQFRKKLESDLENLQIKLDENNTTETLDNFRTTKRELEDMEKEHMNSIIFRSKAKWVEDGEKNTKYFLNLEKKNYLNKLITTLDIDGNLTSDAKTISNEQTRFYKTLYTEKLIPNSTTYADSESTFFNQPNCPRLTKVQKNFCDNELNESEILKSLKALKNGKTPGTDGLPPDFYKFFWVDIKSLVINSLKYALASNELSIEQKRGIINLIPKKNKNRLFLKNWRPISLLNTDYKLLAKTLALRLQNVLPNIINEDQTGYLPNRYIGQNIRLLEDITFFTMEENLPGIILSIDFEKAFDSINWNFLYKTLQTFNFGEKFISYIRTMYHNIESTVLNNGYTNQFFKLERGVRQGCPLSAYLFILSIEILAINIRNNNDIHGIKIGSETVKISLLADDITVLLNDLKSVKKVIDTLKLFKNCAGLTINIDKSTAKYIGTLSKCDYFPHGLSWIKTPIETLGIIITNDPEKNYLLNFQNRIASLKATLNIWSQRNLSIKGKITIINNLALAPLIYVSSVTSTPAKAIAEINNTVQSFLWRNKSAKISQKTLIQNIDKGGLKLCHFETKVNSLMLTWTKRLSSPLATRWKLMPKQFYQCSNLHTYFNSNHKLLTKKKIPTFYKKIHDIYMKSFKKEPNNLTEILNESIWLNERIKAGKNYIYLKSWEKNNVLIIKDLFSEFGNLLSHKELQAKYHLKTTFLQTLQIHKSIPPDWIKLINSNLKIPISGASEIKININNKYKNLDQCSSKDFYWHLINITNHIPSCITKWSTIYSSLNDAHTSEWKAIFNHPFKTCRETKLQSLQFKIIHRTIACNHWLYNIKIAENNTCIFCNSHPDTIEHFFLLCNNVNHFWVSFNNWWKGLTNQNLIEINIPSKLQQNILFGFPDHTDTTSVLNYCILQAKSYIYNKKINKLNDMFLLDFLIYLKAKLNQEKYILTTINKQQKFSKFLFVLENL